MPDQGFSGGCLCGAVRFSSSRPPLIGRACWCRVCQYLASGNASISIIAESAAMSVAGELAAYESRADSGNVIRRSFCPTCGTPLFCEAVGESEYKVVRVGALDDTELGRPQSIIWAGSAPSWGWCDASLPATTTHVNALESVREKGS
ncbi:MAG: hypothetical protein K0S56_1051 [Microvirga sp.]|jgi:hypothetical protein|nr:hypothetical protein [Microvirga sp.]